MGHCHSKRAAMACRTVRSWWPRNLEARCCSSGLRIGIAFDRTSAEVRPANDHASPRPVRGYVRRTLRKWKNGPARAGRVEEQLELRRVEQGDRGGGGRLGAGGPRPQPLRAAAFAKSAAVPAAPAAPKGGGRNRTTTTRAPSRSKNGTATSPCRATRRKQICGGATTSTLLVKEPAPPTTRTRAKISMVRR